MQQDDSKLTLPVLRAAEVEEMMERPPSWIMRWGVFLIFVILSGVLTVSWFIKYPDMIKASAIITTDPAPLSVLSRADGKLFLLLSNGTEVKSGDHMAYVESEVSYSDILLLNKQLVAVEDDSFSISGLQAFLRHPAFQMGVLTTAEISFREATEVWIRFTEQQSHGKQINLLRNQLYSIRLLEQNQNRQLGLHREEMKLLTERFNGDSVLYAQQTSSHFEFVDQKRNYLKEARGFNNSEGILLNSKLQAEQIEMQILQLELDFVDKQKYYLNDLKGKHHRLTSEINKWILQYVLVAPSDGHLVHLHVLQNGRTVKSNEELISVLPNTDAVIAYAELPLTSSGLVKVGQDVNVRLENYPYQRYGMLTGEVSEISPIPNDQGYLLKFTLTNGLTTTHHYRLELKYNLKGELVIITKDIRLLNRMMYSLSGLINDR